MTVLSALAPLLALIFVFWLLLGRSGRARDRTAASRRRGGRTARDRGFLGLPARDRAFQPGLILLALTVVALVKVIGEATVSGGSGPAWTAFWFGLVIAGGFAVRADIVSAGMGLLGIVSLVLARLGGLACDVPASSAENRLWLLYSALVIAGVVVLRTVLPRVSSGHRTYRGPLSIWTSSGYDKGPGVIGGTLLVVFGLMELADLFLAPTTSEAFALMLGRDIGGIAFVAATLVLVVGAGLMPEFTMSLVGLLVAAAELLAWVATPRCEDPTVVLAAGVAFVGMYWVTRRLL